MTNVKFWKDSKQMNKKLFLEKFRSEIVFQMVTKSDLKLF